MTVVPQVKQSLRKSFVLITIFLLVLLSLGLLVSCGGGGSGKNLFVVSQGATSVGTYQFSSSGALTLGSGSVATGPNPQSILITPSQTFAYVADDSGPTLDGGIYEYSVSKTTGGLVNVNNNPSSTSSTTTASITINAGISPVDMATDSKGTLLFVANRGSNNISVYTIDPTYGSLTEIAGSPFSTGAVAPVGLVARGTNLFVADAGNGAGGAISVFTFDATKGTLTAVGGSPFPAGQHLSSIDADASGKFLYATDDQLNEVLGFSIGSGGQLTAMSTPAYATGTTPTYVRVNPAGGALYVADRGSNDLTVFTMDSSSGALTAASNSPVKVGTAPSCIAFDAANNLMFVGNSGSASISVFKVSGGTLTAASGSPFNSSAYSQPIGLATPN